MSPLGNVTTHEWEEARRAMASLISKSEKAQQKVALGTWQHTMLEGNLKALRIACAVVDKRVGCPDSFAPDDLGDALRSFASMMSKTEKAQARFSPATSQYTLLQNRLKALRLAEALMRTQSMSATPVHAKRRIPRTRDGSS